MRGRVSLGELNKVFSGSTGTGISRSRQGTSGRWSVLTHVTRALECNVWHPKAVERECESHALYPAARLDAQNSKKAGFSVGSSLTWLRHQGRRATKSSDLPWTVT